MAPFEIEVCPRCRLKLFSCGSPGHVRYSRFTDPIGDVRDPKALSVVPATPQGLHRQAEAQWLPEPARNTTCAGCHGHV